MKKGLFFRLFIVSVFAAGCISNGKNGKGGQDDAMLHKVQIEDVNVTPEINGVEVEVAGKLPSPAYSFEHFDVMTDGNVIVVTPLAKRDPDIIAAQQLIAFEQTLNVDSLQPGTYEIRVVGKGNLTTSRHVTIRG